MGEPAAASGDDVVLDVADVSVTFGERRDRLALSRVSLQLTAGKVMAVVGESGCGKSLTALTVMGLLPRDAHVVQGQVEVCGSPVVGASERQLRKLRGRDVAMVFQDPMLALNPLQPIGRQIAEPLELHTSMSRSARYARVLELLDAVGISDPRSRARQLPHEFSGGLRQRITIAIALACRPRLLIADEPTTALDVTIQAQILDLQRELTGAQDTGVLFITHDMGVVAEIADEVSVMYAGHVVESGPVRDLFAHPTHPYTRALLRSVPRPDTPTQDDLPTIAGRVPAPGEAGAGCPFEDRCEYRSAQCATRPGLDLVRAAHRVACWHPYGEEDAG
ncbi:MAG: ATP-binding cassette domain-containing protein [Streptosporangiales bacterium]|nr:ATP-binding cassette domain-containing protein [Streptosporangiales bacterium]